MAVERIFEPIQYIGLTDLKFNLYTMDKHYTRIHQWGGVLWSSLYYLESGDVEVQTVTNTFRVHEGEFWFIPQDLQYIPYSVSDKPLKYYLICFCFLENNGYRFDKKYGLTKIEGFDSKEILHWFERMQPLYVGSDVDKLTAASEFYAMFARVLPHLNPATPRNLHRAVEAATKYIDEHCTEDFTVAELAEKCFISEQRLFRLFKEQLDTSPIQYKNIRKVRKAQYLLITTNYSIEKIAEMTNFQSTSYFRKAIKKVTANTPTHYRKIFRVPD